MALSDNLVAYYSLDNTSDATGNGYTLTNNNTVSFAAGFIDNGADFGSPNSNKSLSISNNLGIAGNGAFTIAFWWKRAAELNSGQEWFLRLTSTTSSSRGMQFEYQYNSGTRRIVGYTGNAVIYNVALGTGWNHLGFSRAGGDGSATKLYLNGSNVATGTSGTDTLDSANLFCFGAAIPSTAFTSTGIGDEVGIWSRALDDTEFTDLYNAGLGLSYADITGGGGGGTVNRLALLGVGA